MEGGAELKAPIFTGCNVNVGKKDEGELLVIYSDSIGSHPAGFGTEKFHVAGDFLADVQFELDDLEELGEMFILTRYEQGLEKWKRLLRSIRKQILKSNYVHRNPISNHPFFSLS